MSNKEGNMIGIVAYFKIDITSELEQFKELHRDYINKNKESITYGGVFLNDDNRYAGLIYILQTESKTEAELFLREDPYYHLLQTYKIHRFNQKIPGST